MTKEQLLIEIEELLRTAPNEDTFRDNTQENLDWFGRAMAAINLWNMPIIIRAQGFLDDIQGVSVRAARSALKHFMIILNQARHQLRMETVGPVSVAITTGMTFEYFDELRKKIEVARTDIFFVDPYLDADFVSRYLPHVSHGVSIRLLAREKLRTLLPAARAFISQYQTTVQIRSDSGFHDRYLFVDGSACYQSGASFKDGAKTALTTITQITDAFDVVFQTYETMWQSANVEL